MKLIDIDNQEAINLSKEAEEFIKKEYPPDDFDEMYDLDGDMCVDEGDYEEVEMQLAQRKLIGYHHE